MRISLVCEVLRSESGFLVQSMATPPVPSVSVKTVPSFSVLTLVLPLDVVRLPLESVLYFSHWRTSSNSQ